MRTRIALIAAGVLAMAYAGAGALTDPDLDPAGVLVFLAGVLIAHDAVWMPVVLAAGAVLTRLVPRRRRTAARIAAISAAAVIVVALPLVLGFGRQPDNPSVLPQPYGRNLALVLLAVATLPAVRWRTRKKPERPGEGGADPSGR